MPDAPAPAQPRPLTRNFRNWLSWSGIVLAAGGLFSFFFLFAIDFFAGHPNPYVGILTYVVAPLFFVAGIFFTLLGALIRWHTRRRAVRAAEPLAIKIDLSRSRDRRILVLFVAGSVGFLFLSALGSYQTYQFTESVQFCGQACHGVMKPGVDDLPALAACARRLRGMSHRHRRDLVCALEDLRHLPGVCGHVQQISAPHPHADQEPAPRPGNLRAMPLAAEIRRQPRPHLSHYLSATKPTRRIHVRLLLKVGGGDPTHGPVGGIHWHMNVGNKIEYIATDEARQKIPWVRMTDIAGRRHRIPHAGLHQRHRCSPKSAGWIAWIATTARRTATRRPTRRQPGHGARQDRPRAALDQDQRAFMS